MPGAKTSTSMGNMMEDADKHADTDISALTGNAVTVRPAGLDCEANFGV
jgi:hypothetical protein